ncbi:wax ester/triacylglycerol synthase family O-acyltransferase [Actinomycetospora lutea]|uniref:wax ester/triacylglycerol synthase domain-containing protein n=1 Tax=Actinomycetospora lutea TaxID=663604 RepID=UPI0023653E1D|nr:wax ester/triacylglycerol synthase domain-containing protein [Actinomycetospora lutea]MDD7939599.1 wax ester/triacylglycerol synthase family O-acyltransferase [Actinomycetospora lutea]
MRGPGARGVDDVPLLDRASASDRAFLAMDGGRFPEQFGVVLRLDPDRSVDPEWLRDLLAERVPAVARLRRRLVRTPWGCGGPIWVDDPAFDIRRHVLHATCPDPGDRAALADLAWRLVARRLPREAPLWSAVLVTGLEEGGAAIVIVLHHALADGVGGLAVLTDLVDPGTDAPAPGFPARPPRPRDLARDAARRRWRTLRDLRVEARLLRASLTAGGGLRPAPAAPCSLLAPTGPRRRVLVLHHELAGLREAVHARGATVNDALLAAVAAALQQVLARRGEELDSIAIAVPVSGRAGTQRRELGNLVSPLLIRVPAGGRRDDRLAAVSLRVRAGRGDALGPPPIALLGGLFRPLAALGGFRFYMRHQRRMHTLVSHVRGPRSAVALGGVPVTAAFPVGAGEEGLTVCVEALSYAGNLAITVLVDPDHVADGDDLVEALEHELRALGELTPLGH